MTDGNKKLSKAGVTPLLSEAVRDSQKHKKMTFEVPFSTLFTATLHFFAALKIKLTQSDKSLLL